MTIIIPLKDIVFDDLKWPQLSNMSEIDIIVELRKTFSFLPDDTEITISEGVVTLQMQAGMSDSDMAESLYKKGTTLANSGDYHAAIRHYTQYLDINPADASVRRNIGMAWLELGDIARAKEFILQAIKIDPSDAWAFSLLGNICAKHDRRYDLAEFYYEKGLSISPNDSNLLNNYAALQANIGKHDKAEEIFRRAIAATPTQPNPYIGLATLLHATERSREALRTLDSLFSAPRSEDIRAASLYAHAQDLYKKICLSISSKEHDVLVDYVDRFREMVEFEVQCPITVTYDETLTQPAAVTKLAWIYDTPEHRIICGASRKLTAPHLIAHEIEHIILGFTARKNKLNRLFTSNSQTLEAAAKAIRKHEASLVKKGWQPESVRQLMAQLVHGMCSQLYNSPIDMVVEYNVFTKHPELRACQLTSLYDLYNDFMQVLRSDNIRQATPPTVYTASNTLNCATAIFMDFLFHSATSFSQPYKDTPYYTNGRKLFLIWKNRYKATLPGDEFQLVDEFAKVLKLDSWYAWQKEF